MRIGPRRWGRSLTDASKRTLTTGSSGSNPGAQAYQHDLVTEPFHLRPASGEHASKADRDRSVTNGGRPRSQLLDGSNNQVI